MLKWNSDTIANIAKLEPELKNIGWNQIGGFVIYDLTGRDCAAKASNGELAAGDLATYKSSYIDGSSPC
jgi:cellulose 1,4-beta-cellobiosidase